MTDVEHLRAVANAVCAATGLTLCGNVGAGAFKATFHVTTTNGLSKALKIYNRNNRSARVEREVEAIFTCHQAGVDPHHYLTEVQRHEEQVKGGAGPLAALELPGATGRIILQRGCALLA